MSEDPRATEYGVWRLEDDKWSSLLGPTSSDAIATGSEGANTLAVETQGDDATFFINRTRVGSIHSTERRGSFAGVISETSTKEDALITWRFGNYAYRQ